VVLVYKSGGGGVVVVGWGGGGGGGGGGCSYTYIGARTGELWDVKFVR